MSFHDAIKRAAKGRSVTTRFILDRLDATIISITPLMAQIDKLSEEVEDSPRKVIKDLNLLLVKAGSLVETYTKLRRRNLLKKYRYTRRIIELEATLRWMVDVDVQVNQWADIKELMAKMSEMNTKLDEITRQPTVCICFKSNRSTSQSINQDIVEETDRSSEKSAECSNGAECSNDAECSNGAECSYDGSKPKIDIHIGWRSRKRNKYHAIRFVVK